MSERELTVGGCLVNDSGQDHYIPENVMLPTSDFKSLDNGTHAICSTDRLAILNDPVQLIIW